MKINNLSQEIINTLKILILKYGNEEEKDKILSESESEDNKDSGIEIQIMSLKPDTPKFIPSEKNVLETRLKQVADKDLDNTLFFYDLFDLVKNNSLKQFGLKNISLNDLTLNNIQQAIIVVNKKGNILKIIANKEANMSFLFQLINNTLEHKIKNIKKPLKPFKPTPY
jgi:hypothetical protein